MPRLTKRDFLPAIQASAFSNAGMSIRLRITQMVLFQNCLICAQFTGKLIITCLTKWNGIKQGNCCRGFSNIFICNPQFLDFGNGFFSIYEATPAVLIQHIFNVPYVL